jgi:hypothetical protein
MFAGVPDDERRRITCGNAVEFFHLDAKPAEFQATADVASAPLASTASA